MARRGLRLLVITDAESVPPAVPRRDGREYWAMTRDVTSALEAEGHAVTLLGLRDTLAPLERALAETAPNLVVNLLEGFRGSRAHDHHVVARLELADIPYTGCTPRGMIVGRDKALAKQILAWHGVATAPFVVYSAGERVRSAPPLRFPVIVKPLAEDSSLGIARASVVASVAELRARVHWLARRYGVDAIAEEFIAGRDLYVPVLGNRQLRVFPAWSLHVRRVRSPLASVATVHAKYDARFRRRHAVREVRARLAGGVARRVAATARAIYRALALAGYARLDFRLSIAGDIVFLEANPNPDIARDGVFARAARAAGMPYGSLLRRIVSLGLERSEQNG